MKNGIQGKRIYPKGNQINIDKMNFGDYYKNEKNGIWYAYCGFNLLANLENHTVTENQDGSITVHPSVLVAMGNKLSWHGFITNGYFKEC